MIGVLQGCFCTEWKCIWAPICTLGITLPLVEVLLCCQVVFTMGASLPGSRGDFYEVCRPCWPRSLEGEPGRSECRQLWHSTFLRSSGMQWCSSAAMKHSCLWMCSWMAHSAFSLYLKEIGTSGRLSSPQCACGPCPLLTSLCWSWCWVWTPKIHSLVGVQAERVLLPCTSVSSRTKKSCSTCQLGNTFHGVENNIPNIFIIFSTGSTIWVCWLIQPQGLLK